MFLNICVVDPLHCH